VLENKTSATRFETNLPRYRQPIFSSNMKFRMFSSHN